MNGEGNSAVFLLHSQLGTVFAQLDGFSLGTSSSP